MVFIFQDIFSIRRQFETYSMEDSQRERESQNSIDTYSKLILPSLGLVITLITLLFGSGVTRTLRQPQVNTTISNLIFDDKVLNSCYIRNDGQAIAESVVIQLNSAETEPFASDLEVYGAEGQWDIIGGKIGDNYARIEMKRLAPTHVLTATAATTLSTTFDCKVSFQGGTVLPARPRFTLTMGDFIVLIVVNNVVTMIIIIGYVTFQKAIRKND